MNEDLKRKLKEAVEKSVHPHIVKHLNRKKDTDHRHIDDFQHSICKELNNNTNCVFSKGKCSCPNSQWSCEYPASGEHKDSIDIYGQLDPKCIIEIDTVRHDQIAAKFVSRLALCGLDERMDYVAILYDSTQESGRQSAEKFIRYMDAIIKAVNPYSSLIGIYVHVVIKKNQNRKKKGVKGKKDRPKVPKNAPILIEVWDCEKQAFTIKGDTSPKIYNSMPACAKGAITHYVNTHTPKPTFLELQQQVFCKQNGTSYIFANAEEGKGHKAEIVENVLTGDNQSIYVDTQFRAKGNQSNWFKFVEVCENNAGIIIKQDFVDKLKNLIYASSSN